MSSVRRSSTKYTVSLDEEKGLGMPPGNHQEAQQCGEGKKGRK